MSNSQWLSTEVDPLELRRQAAEFLRTARTTSGKRNREAYERVAHGLLDRAQRLETERGGKAAA
jgi:hypothetical protein